MRTRPRILLDIDGVFANFIDASLPIIKSIVLRRPRGPTTLVDEERAWRAEIECFDHEDVKTYRMETIFGMTAVEIDEWFALVKEPGYCAAIRPYEGARECVAALQEIGDVHPVTFPWPQAPHWIIERERWLADELGINPGLAVYTSQKHVVAGDIFVEDTTKYLIQWREHHHDGVAIRMRRPYNEREPFTQGVTVRNFAALLQEVEAACDLREKFRRHLWDEK